jgi:hypothetical protein
MPDEKHLDEEASDRASELLRRWEETRTVTVYLTRLGEVILVRQRGEGEGRLVGELLEILRPGGSFMGRPWDFWVSLGPGRHEVPDDD